MPENDLQIIKGGVTTQIFTGVGPHTIALGMRGAAITVRVTGTIIAAITAQDPAAAAATAYVPTGWIGTVLFQGEHLVSRRPIVTITLTAATDSISVDCVNPS